MKEIRAFAELADVIRSRQGPVRLVGVDGLGGAGKTTFATRLARHLDGAPVVHTDDFATHDEPVEWWPRMLGQVVEPLLDSHPATFRPYDWVHQTSGDAVTVAPAPVVLIEGVGATRKAWRDRLAFRIWVDAPRDLRLRRGLARDGEHLAGFWAEWMRAEDGYVRDENPRGHVDLVVDGDPGQPHDPEEQFVAEPQVSGPRAAVRAGVPGRGSPPRR